MFSSIAVGLEVIEEGNPIDSDSDMGRYAGSDLSDTGKFLIQVQQLNRRVRELERDLQRNTMGVWSKLAFFAFTIINPILLHWLFLKRRWRTFKASVEVVAAITASNLHLMARLEWPRIDTDLYSFFTKYYKTIENIKVSV